MKTLNVSSLPLALVASLGLGGCITPEYVDQITLLADMPALELEVRSKHGPTELVLHYDPEPLKGCAILSPSLTASLDGAPLRISQWGHGNYSLDNEWGSCTEPVLSFPGRMQGPHLLQIADESLTITGDFSTALQLREMTPVPDEAWRFTRGQTVTVRWTPASDLAAAVPNVSLSVSGRFYAMTPAVAGDLITFTLPNDVVGGALLRILVKREPEALSCTGVPCRVSERVFDVFEQIFIP